MDVTKKFVAIINDCVQDGPDHWHQVYTSKVFDTSDTIQSVLDWAKNWFGEDRPVYISDIVFSNYSE